MLLLLEEMFNGGAVLLRADEVPIENPGFPRHVLRLD
jgi:hypothetical protein